MISHARRNRVLALTLGIITLIAFTGCQGDSTTPASEGDSAAPQPYAGLEQRDIRALAPERVADLLAGRGAGYALAAELNHYPGPTHVLELGTQLGLSAEQQKLVSSIKAAMQDEAIQLGTRLVELEGDLDREFRSRAITSEQLSSLTNGIATIEGELRDVHLQAHLQMVEVLSDEQISRYDDLRGYVTDDGSVSGPPAGHESHDSQH